MTLAQKIADMATNQPVPEWNTMLLLVAVVSVIVWAFIQLLKQFCADYLTQKPTEKKPWWWKTSLRFLALGSGAVLGSTLYESLGGVGSGWPWGTAIGAGAGSLASLVVAVVKQRIKAMGTK